RVPTGNRLGRSSAKADMSKSSSKATTLLELAPLMPEQRDSSETAGRSAAISVNPWGQCGPARKRTARSCHVRGDLLAARFRLDATDAHSSKIEAVVLGQGLEGRLGPRPQMLDHFSSDQRRQACRGAVVGAARDSGQKARGKEIAGTGCVNHSFHRASRNRLGLLTRDDQTTLFAAGDHGQPSILAQRLERRLEVGGIIEAVQLALVREDEVDGAGANELEEFGTITIDAERIGQSKGDVTPGVVRDFCRLQESLLGARWIPEIALELDDLRRRNGVCLDVFRMQILCSAEISIHRALAVRRDQHVATRR